ncbi:MAG: Uncharacterized protein G01um10147_956 [Microgenomates group bacterium Gr01-1014_7]|nr:MAG: Uncharacterized protein G01um10147_956 [Microgenomates group bacterium Gr01-1014_7]
MIRKLIIAGIILLGLVIGYRLLIQITDALKSGDRLSAQAEAVYKLEIRNKELKAKLKEIQSPQFIEEQARNKLGLGKAGETIFIIPEQKIKEILGASESAKLIRLPNWLGWWKVFFKCC